MIFGNKVKKVVNLEKAEDIYKNEERVPLEKGDKTALIISALIVYVPVLLIFCSIIFGLAYFFIR